MDINCAMVVCLLCAVATMELQVLVAIVLAWWKAAPAPRASKLGRMLANSLCVFIVTYVLAYGTLSFLVPYQGYLELIAAGVAGVVDLAVTANSIPRPGPVEG